MSKETLSHLNTQTLIGFSEKRGFAWHYREELQGDEPNHYIGAIPAADVVRRLFSFTAERAPLYVALPADIDTMTTITDTGEYLRFVEAEGRQAIVRSDTGLVMGLFKEGYTIHQFQDWLLAQVSNLVSDTTPIGSAGLLRGGAVAWVSIEVPDTVITPEGVAFRPNLLACTSHDGSLATTYARCVTNTVCDNTMSSALNEGGERVKVKHSRYSHLKLDQAQDALNLLTIVEEDFAAQVADLCAITVTDRQWSKFLDTMIPVSPDKGRSQTMAQNKQDALKRLWTTDNRVSPWKNTAFGVVQAVNTFTHHEGIVRGTERAERNMLRAVTGGVDKLDADTLATLQSVLA